MNEGVGMQKGVLCEEKLSESVYTEGICESVHVVEKVSLRVCVDVCTGM